LPVLFKVREFSAKFFNLTYDETSSYQFMFHCPSFLRSTSAPLFFVWFVPPVFFKWNPEAAANSLSIAAGFVGFLLSSLYFSLVLLLSRWDSFFFYYISQENFFLFYSVDVTSIRSSCLLFFLTCHWYAGRCGILHDGEPIDFSRGQYTYLSSFLVNFFWTLSQFTVILIMLSLYSFIFFAIIYYMLIHLTLFVVCVNVFICSGDCSKRLFLFRFNQMDNYSFLKVLSTCISIQLQQHYFFYY
jgi:hypothetical protein